MQPWNKNSISEIKDSMKCKTKKYHSRVEIFPQIYWTIDRPEPIFNFVLSKWMDTTELVQTHWIGDSLV